MKNLRLSINVVAITKWAWHNHPLSRGMKPWNKLHAPSNPTGTQGKHHQSLYGEVDVL